MQPFDPELKQLTRRTFFKTTGLAAGRIALGSLLFPDCFRAAAAHRTGTGAPCIARATPFCPARQANHLPVHERGPLAD